MTVIYWITVIRWFQLFGFFFGLIYSHLDSNDVFNFEYTYAFKNRPLPFLLLYNSTSSDEATENKMVDSKFNFNSNRINEMIIIIILFGRSAYQKKKKNSIQMKHKSNCSRFQIQIRIDLLLMLMRVNWLRTTYCSFGIRFGLKFGFWIRGLDKPQR